MADDDGLDYRGWDVHAYTTDMRRVLDEWLAAHPRVAVQFRTPVPDSVIARVTDILSTFPNAAQIAPVLTKCRARSVHTAEGWYYADSHLANVNIWAVFTYAVRLSLHPDTDMDDLLSELLVDAGQTCIQGDSHRILFFILSITRDPPLDRLD